MYLLESKRLEPPRGSLAHVSSEIPAVGNDWDVLAECARGLGSQLTKWQAHRPGEVFLLVLIRREHLDELRTVRDEALQRISVDCRGHCMYSSIGASSNPLLAEA